MASFAFIIDRPVSVRQGKADTVQNPNNNSNLVAHHPDFQGCARPARDRLRKGGLRRLRRVSAHCANHHALFIAASVY